MAVQLVAGNASVKLKSKQHVVLLKEIAEQVTEFFTKSRCGPKCAGGNLEGNDLQATELIVSIIQYVAINNEDAGHRFCDAI
jgi:hypothetical protein